MAIAGRSASKPEFKNIVAAPFDFWSAPPKASDYLDTMTVAIADLKGHGLTGVQVAEDLIRCRLSPLKARKNPAWVNPAGHDPD